MSGLTVFGERLRTLREGLNMSQKVFAERISSTAASISAYEKGDKKPGADVIIRICEAFGVSADWLLGLSDNQNRLSVLESALCVFAHLHYTGELLDFYIKARTSETGLEQFFEELTNLYDLNKRGILKDEYYFICVRELISKTNSTFKGYCWGYDDAEAILLFAPK